MNQKKRNILLGAGAVLLTVLVTALTASGSVLAEEGAGRAGEIKSKGIVNYGGGSVVIDTGDLTYLAGEIDTLEQSYKSGILAALNGIGAYLREDGSVTHQKDAQASQPAQPAFHMLTSAITDSQSSATGIADLAGDTYYKTKDGRLITASSGEDTSGAEEISLAAATADDLSAGTVAYVDGQLLLGTGEENRVYYELVMSSAIFYSADGNFKPIMDELGLEPGQFTEANFRAQAPAYFTGIAYSASSSGSHGSNSKRTYSYLTLSYNNAEGTVYAYFPQSNASDGNAKITLTQADPAGYFFSPSGSW